MFVKAVTLLSLVVVVAVKCTPTPVSNTLSCMQNQWEGSFFGTDSQFYNGTTVVRDTFGTISIDYARNTFATTQSISSGGVNIAEYTTLAIENVVYYYDAVRQLCRKVVMQSSPQPLRFCTPSDTIKHVGSWTIDDKTTDTYRIEFPGSRTTITLLRDSYTLVSEVIEQRHGEINQMKVFQFGNTTLGISDPSAFEVPSYCPANATTSTTTPTPVSSTTTPTAPVSAVQFTTPL